MQMSKSKHTLMGIIVYFTVAISASMSAHYGFISAGETASMYEKCIMAATFALFDIIVVILASEAANKWLTRAAAKILVVVLFSLSCISGAAYMIGQQSKDQNTEVAMLKRQINMLDDNMSKLDPVTRPGNLRELRAERDAAYQNLQSVYSKQGGEVTSSNAFFVYIGRMIDVSPDGLATITKVVTMLTLNLSGIILAALRSLSNPYAQTQTTVYSAKPLGVSVSQPQRTENGDNRTLEQIKKAILSKQIKPSVTAVARNFCGNNRADADYYLQLLEKKNVIKNQGHGKKRLIVG